MLQQNDLEVGLPVAVLIARNDCFRTRTRSHKSVVQLARMAGECGSSDEIEVLIAGDVLDRVDILEVERVLPREIRDDIRR